MRLCITLFLSTQLLFGTSVGFCTASSSFGMRALMTLYIPRETAVDSTMYVLFPTCPPGFCVTPRRQPRIVSTSFGKSGMDLFYSLNSSCVVCQAIRFQRSAHHWRSSGIDERASSMWKIGILFLRFGHYQGRIWRSTATYPTMVDQCIPQAAVHIAALG